MSSGTTGTDPADLHDPATGDDAHDRATCAGPLTASTGRRTGPGSRGRRLAIATTVVAVTVVAAAVVVEGVDRSAISLAWRRVLADPGSLVVVVVVYGSAFAVRARVWRHVVPALSWGQALAGIHLALAGNHVLPLRLGEPLRVVSVVRRTGVTTGTAGASTVLLRGLDLVALVALAIGASGGVLWSLTRWGAVVAGALALAVAVVGAIWLARQRRRDPGLGRPDAACLVGIVLAWALEAVVIHQAAAWAGIDLSPAEAVSATVVAVGAQVAAIAPGGFGTYEAAGTAALVVLGVAPATALAVVLVAHAVKTAYALVAGAVALVLPRPGMAGRLRLPRDRPPRPAPLAAAGPVVLFLPAMNEAATVADVVGRCPTSLRGHEVTCLVVDDGSTDDTCRQAAIAGAEVVRLPHNRGLGAAVREGLAQARARDAVAVAFCDADGEYDPAQLEDLVGPILDGRADYVVGSRFTGDIERMLPHRRLGNLVLTRWTAWTAREPITDGQSGYRALSPRAAASARVEHDFNYAQVLTLDLLSRGSRYIEVPIRYRFREQGRSFIRLGRYLAAVVPAVHRVVNRAPAAVAPAGRTPVRSTPTG